MSPFCVSRRLNIPWHATACIWGYSFQLMHFNPFQMSKNFEWRPLGISSFQITPLLWTSIEIVKEIFRTIRFRWRRSWNHRKIVQITFTPNETMTHTKSVCRPNKSHANLFTQGKKKHLNTRTQQSNETYSFTRSFQQSTNGLWPTQNNGTFNHTHSF